MNGNGSDIVTAVCDRGTHSVLLVRGVLGLRTGSTLRRALDKLLLDRGRVVANLNELSCSWPPAVSVFPTALAQAGGWPLARLALCGAQESLLRALTQAKVNQAVPMGPTNQRPPRYSTNGRHG